MIKLAPLTYKRLNIVFDPQRVPWENSDAIPRKRKWRHAKIRQVLQPRVVQAMELALQITTHGYNVFIAGDAHLGRTYMVREMLKVHAATLPTPPDLLYVNNFSSMDKPTLIAVAAGYGKKLKQSLHETLARIRKELPSRFETNAFIKRKVHIFDAFQTVRTGLLKKMDTAAEAKGFHLDVDEGGALMLYPMVEGKRLSEEEFDSLDGALRHALKRKGDELLRAMSGLMRQLTRAENQFKDDERSLEREFVAMVLDEFLSPLEKKIARAYTNTALMKFLEDMRKDILENLDMFISRETTSTPQPSMHVGAEAQGAVPATELDTFRYDINLFVDNSEQVGAPIIMENHPTLTNVLGCIERESEMGALITDFTLIKPGSIHKANGGFLLLHAEDILHNPHAWDALVRTLRSNQARIEDGIDGGESSMRVKSIEPDALPLNIKVILIGSEEVYETLLLHDERFAKLFKIKAHMVDSTHRTKQGTRAYIEHLACIIDEASLLPFDRTALAWMVDYGSRLEDDQRKLSLKFPILREIMIEASAMAHIQSKAMVDRQSLEKASGARMYRVNHVEDIFMEEYDREMIKVRTAGKDIGRVNGLSVTWHGDFEFGLPHQISCTVGVGHGGVIDLEREAELGGPIHTKAMMILKSYLVDLFARRKPLVFTGSLCFEQSYAGIEGDSASGAELVALLSALAQVPVRLDIAFTGALSQSGQIMAVGGVTRKIEGFFNVCARHGLTGSQGVIIPQDNVEHLMLSSRVLEAIRQEQFFVYAVRSIEDALFLLTGIYAGRRLKHDTFTPHSLYDLVDKRLIALGAYAETAPRRTKRRPA